MVLMQIATLHIFPPLKKGGRGGFAVVGDRQSPKIPLNPPFAKGEVPCNERLSMRAAGYTHVQDD
jgi:hypothetical protein